MHAPLPISPRLRLRLSDDGTIEGYASLFGAVDSARDMVMPGAFEKTLRTKSLRRVPMLFQHDPSEVIGIWDELREDLRGLYARGRLIPDVQRSRELIALLRNGAIDGLSIGYRTSRAKIDPKTRVRRLHEVELWEVSLVTFPLLDGARVFAVKQSPQRRTADAAWARVSGAADGPALLAMRRKNPLPNANYADRAARKNAMRLVTRGVRI